MNYLKKEIVIGVKGIRKIKKRGYMVNVGNMILLIWIKTMNATVVIIIKKEVKKEVKEVRYKWN